MHLGIFNIISTSNVRQSQANEYSEYSEYGALGVSRCIMQFGNSTESG